MRRTKEREINEAGQLKSRDPRSQGRRDFLKGFNKRGDERQNMRNPDYNAKFNFSFSFSSSESEDEKDSDENQGKYLTKSLIEREKENHNKVESK